VSKPYLQQVRHPGVSGGCDKFHDPDSSYVLPVRQVWADALVAVDMSPKCLVKQNKTSAHFRHYVLPDPALLVMPGDDKKKLAYLLMWLCACPVLLYCSQKQDLTALSNQAWCDFLEMGHSDKLKSDTAAAAYQEEIQKIMGGVLGTAGLSEASPNANLGPVYWRDKELPLNKLPRFSMFRKILWELYELNFRLKLTNLDQCANRDPVEEDPAICVKCLWSCFSPSFDLPFVMISYMNIGLVTNDWREWVPFISALMNMMSCWEESKPEVFKYQLHRAEELSEGLALELECEAACFYMQIFYNHFGYAPLIPHCVLPAV